MTILYIHNSETEPIEELSNWVKNIKTLGHKIKILTDNKKLKKQDFAKDKNIKILSFEIPPADSITNKLKIIGKYRAEILKILKADDINLIYSKFSYISPGVKKAIEGLEFLSLGKIPSIIELSDKLQETINSKETSLLKKLFYKHIQYIVFQHANLIICSEKHNELLRSRFHISKDKILAIQSKELSTKTLEDAIKKVATEFTDINNPV